MLFELSEVFVCPSCRPDRALVVLVEAAGDGRVREGRLGCPECETKVPVRSGTIRFDLVHGPARGPAGGVDAPSSSGSGPAAPVEEVADRIEAGLLAGVDREEGATRLAALLAADRAEGVLMLGPGLARLAGPLSRLAGDAEVLALQVGVAKAEAEAGVSRAAGVDPGSLPVATGRLAGVALLRPGAGEVREAVRVLREGGRAVLLEPDREGRDALETQPIRTAAGGASAVVAVREPGDAPARA